MTSVDGLEYIGTEKGKRKYRARLVVTDGKTGKKQPWPGSRPGRETFI